MASDADWGDHAKAVIYAAVGMTMEYLDCSSLAAFRALTTQSEKTGESIVDVAVAVIDGHYRPTPRDV